MFPPQQFAGHEPSSPDAPRVPSALPRKIPVILPATSSSTAPGQLPGVPGRPPSRLPTERFQPGEEPRMTDGAGIADLLSLPDISKDK